MKEQYIQKIHEACVKANPEIMELKFGCEVKKYQSVFTWLHIQSFSDGIHLISYWNRDTNVVHSVREITKGIEEFEILGRPIRLADILIIIGAKEEWQDIIRGPYCWNLLKDSLTEQSEETLKFIYDLLS